MLTLKEIKEKSVSDNVVELKEVVANVILFADAIALEGEKRSAELEAEKTRATVAEKAGVEAAAAAVLVSDALALVKSELADLKSKQEATAAEQKFNDRMDALDSEFEFEDDERGLLVDEIKALASDEAFAAWMTRAKKLMKEKTKAFKAKKKDDAAKKDKKSGFVPFKKSGKSDKEDAADEGDDEDDTDAKAAEALASAAANLVDAPLDTTIEAEVSLADKYRAAFADTVKIGGRSLADIAKSAKKE